MPTGLMSRVKGQVLLFSILIFVEIRTAKFKEFEAILLLYYLRLIFHRPN